MVWRGSREVNEIQESGNKGENSIQKVNKWSFRILPDCWIVSSNPPLIYLAIDC